MGERRRKRLVQREMEWKVSCERLSLLTNYLGLLSSLEHLVLPSPPPSAIPISNINSLSLSLS